MRSVAFVLLSLLFAPAVWAIADYESLRDLVYRHPQHAAQELEERIEHQLHTAEDFGRLSALLATAHNGLRNREGALRIVDRALLRLPEAPSQPRAELLMVRAMVLADLGEIQQAQRYYSEVIKVAQELKLKPLLTEVLTRVAMSNASLDQFEQALSHIRQAYVLAAELKDERLQALVASEMASLYTQMGQYETALGYYQQGYNFSQNKGDPVETMTSLFNLAGTLRHLKRFAEAQERYLQSLAIAREQGLQEDIAHTMLALADINLQQDNANKAWQWMESLAQLDYGKDDTEYQIGVLLQRTGSLAIDAAFWWALRPSQRFATVELRISDGCPRLEDALCIAGLFRHLVECCVMPHYAPAPASRETHWITQENYWRAMRYLTKRFGKEKMKDKTKILEQAEKYLENLDGL